MLNDVLLRYGIVHRVGVWVLLYGFAFWLIRCGAASAPLATWPTATPLLDTAVDYTTQVAPILRRYCQPCHNPAHAAGDFLVTSYEEVMQTGMYAPNVIAGDMNSNLLRMIRYEAIEAGNPMPPDGPLTPEQIDIITRWVMEGAALPQTP